MNYLEHVPSVSLDGNYSFADLTDPENQDLREKAAPKSGKPPYLLDTLALRISRTVQD